MKYIVSYSGGMGSFCATHKLLQQGIARENIELVFCDTLIEDEELYQFLEDSTKALGLPLTRLQDGRTPWGIYVSQRFAGNSEKAPCSHFLKRVPFKKHLKKHYKDIDYKVVLGIGIEEEHRLPRAQKQYDVEVIAPLIDKPITWHFQYDDILKEYGLKKPRLYKMGFQHNNCGGFCCRGGKAHFKDLLEHMPERYKWHEQQQENMVAMCPSLDKPFLRTTEKGVMRFDSLKKFRIDIEHGKHKEPMFDFGGCGCFIDDEQPTKTKENEQCQK